MNSAVVACSSTHNVVVEISAGGLKGQGAALAFTSHQAAAIRTIARDLGEVLIGAEATEIRAIWGVMLKRISVTGRCGIGMLAMSALDTALWDLLAQVAGLPLFRLIGGSARELPVYAQPGWLSTPVDEVIREAQAFEVEGYQHYKMRVGSADWHRDVDRVTRVRKALDPQTQLLVDANQGWTRLEALAACRQLDDLGLYWIEEPVSADDVVGTALLARALNTPIATGENAFGTREVQPLIDAGAASILMLDLQHCGGPTGWLQAATQADLAGVAISNHLFTQISVHLLAACSNALIVEHMPGWWDDLYDRALPVINGKLTPPEEAGVGFRLCEAAVASLCC